MRKGRSQMAPCRWRRRRADAAAGVVPFHAELCRAHWGFCSCFSRHGSFLVMQRGKLPSADLHKGVGGPYHPPACPGPPGHAQVGEGGIGTWMSLHQTPRGCQDRAGAPMDRGPPPQLGRAPILSPVGGRPLPCAVHSLSPPPHSEQPPPGEPPSPLHSRLLSLGCTIRVSPPGCGAALAPPGPFPLPKSPGPVGPPFPGVAGPPRSPLCPLHMPPAGRSLPGAVGDRHYLSTIRVLSIFKKMM